MPPSPGRLSDPTDAGLAAGLEVRAPGVHATPDRPTANENPVVVRPELSPRDRYLNRDTSWLEFNRRVLAQALDPTLPLLERCKFLSIFSSNLDEFFMKRVGLLRELDQAKLDSGSLDRRRPLDVLAEIHAMVQDMQSQQAQVWESQLLPALAQSNIHVLRYDQLEPDERRRVDEWFNTEVFPVLTPLAVDHGHRFPFLSNLSESLGVMLSPPGSSEKLFARIKIPDQLPRLVPTTVEHLAQMRAGQSYTGDRLRLVWVDEVIRNNLDDVFPGMRILEVMPFRVTRNAAVELEEEGEDILQSVEQELNLRRFAQVVRIETPAVQSPAMLSVLKSELRVKDADIFVRGGPLEYGDLFELVALQRPELKDEPWRPAAPHRLADPDADIFAAIRQGDILLHHPYESFHASVERFITQAVKDPSVLAIKQTLYRTSRDSPFVRALIRAAEMGKQVACLVEVRARFDESRNVRFARELEKHGVHVAYGVVGLKTHCKCALVVRREGRQLRTYAHLGTGNYNSRTAQLYTDLGLLTADPRITQDVVHLFNLLTGRSLKRDYQSLIVAPYTMRDRYMELIDREIRLAQAGRPARIVAKMNALEDSIIMEKLYQASAAGVKITLIVRGFCCLRPGVEGLSENIRVVSVVGRFLEHSRIYHFGAGHTDPVLGDWYIASADWMYRNLSNRVEAGVPIHDHAHRARLNRILDVMLRDCRNAWELRSDGSYRKLEPPADARDGSAEKVGTFRTLMSDALTPST